MSGDQKFPIVDASLYDALKSFREEIFASLNCVKVGQIVSFDKTKKTASVRLMFKRVLGNDEVRENPLLTDCPVFTLQGGGGGVELPIDVGDNCIVLFSDRNLDAWFKSGTPAAPFDARCHDLSDGIALVGLNALNGTLANYETGVAKLFLGTGQYRIKNNKLIMKNGTTDFLALINALFVAIEAIHINNSTFLVDTASIAALEVVKTQFATLFDVP